MAGMVYAEDTRRTKALLDHLGVSRPVRSYFVGNEEMRAKELMTRLSEGETVALVTDAGVPGISDPGYSAVQAALSVGAGVTVVPGPSAVTTALVASGLPADRFVFEGFLPRKDKARTERLGLLSSEARTMVLFTTKRRLVLDLSDLAEALGEDRRCVVAREMTKLHEEFWRGTLGEAVSHWRVTKPLGELTLVVEGLEAGGDMDRAVQETMRRMGEGVSTADAVRDVARELGVSRNTLYEKVLAERAR